MRSPDVCLDVSNDFPTTSISTHTRRITHISITGRRKCAAYDEHLSVADDIAR